MRTQLDFNLELAAVIVMAIAFLACLWAYGSRYPALRGARRAVLVGARLASLLAILLAALGPILHMPVVSKHRNALLVLVDHSGSMEVRDVPGGRSRREAADSAAVAVARAVGDRYAVRMAPFDVALGPVRSGVDRAALVAAEAAAPADGAGRATAETALGDVLKEALDRIDPDSLAAVLVVSDGAVNRGEDPDRALGAALPAFGLLVGASEDPPTVGIAGVEAPSEVVVGAPTSLSVTVHQGARPATSGQVVLREAGRELARAAFTIQGPNASRRLTLPFTPSARGTRFLSVTVEGVPDDPLRDNKRRMVAVRARPAREHVPLLAAAWDWDLRSAARGVEEDTLYEVRYLSPKGAEGVAAADGTVEPLGSALREASTAIVRYDVQTLTPARSDAVLELLNRGGGALLWADPESRPPVESALTRALDLTWHTPPPGLIEATSAELTPEGRAHEVSLLGGDAASAAALWRDLPPVEPVLLIGDSGALRPLLAVRQGTISVPILLAGSLGRGRVVFVNAAGSYRWGLTASGIAGRAGVEAVLYGGIRRWLAAGAADRPVRLVAPDISPEGRTVPVRIETSIGTAGTRARLRARRVDRPSGRAVDDTLAPAPGGFAGTIALGEGVHRLEAIVERAGRVMGTDSMRIAVGVHGVEFEALRAEPRTLEHLAERSGGAAFAIDRAEDLIERLRAPELLRARRATIDVGRSPVLLLVLIAALGLEWALRRRFHLM